MGAVRAVRTKTIPDEDKKALENWNVAIYGLCEHVNVSDGLSFQNMGLFLPQKIRGLSSGTILPPRPFDPHGLAELPGRDSGGQCPPLGIRHVLHRVRLARQREEASTRKTRKRDAGGGGLGIYTTIPSDVLGYDPSERVYMGLLDLSACDDGTLTAVFEDKDGWGRIFTATPQFEGGKLIIEGKVR